MYQNMPIPAQAGIQEIMEMRMVVSTITEANGHILLTNQIAGQGYSTGASA